MLQLRITVPSLHIDFRVEAKKNRTRFFLYIKINLVFHMLSYLIRFDLI